jgi:D-alanine-D-alanine ligase
MLDSEGRPEVLEANAIPGLTDTSLFPMAADAAGIAFEELVSRIVELALEQRTVNRLAPNEWKEIRG